MIPAYLKTYCEAVPSLIQVDQSPGPEIIKILQIAESLCNLEDVCPAPWGVEAKAAEPRLIRMIKALDLNTQDVLGWTVFTVMFVTAMFLRFPNR